MAYWLNAVFNFSGTSFAATDNATVEEKVGLTTNCSSQSALCMIIFSTLQILSLADLYMTGAIIQQGCVLQLIQIPGGRPELQLQLQQC